MLTFVPHLGVKIETIRRWFPTVLKISGKFSLYSTHSIVIKMTESLSLPPTLQF